MVATDKLSVVEAAWEVELEPPDWMVRLACSIQTAVPEMVAPTSFHAVVEDMVMRVIEAGAPPGTSHLPVVLGSASQTPPELIVHTRRQGATGLLAFRHADAPDTGGLDQVAPALAELGGRDILTIGARDGRGETLCLTGVMPEPRKMRSNERRGWESVCAHLSAALRLRQRGITATIEDADLVFDARGSLVYRNAWSGSPSAADDETVDRLRDRLPHVDVRPSERSATWMEAVFDGNWSIIARRETAAAVHFLAVRNPVDATPMRKLTELEVETVRALMTDAPAKAIADDLGITEAALARRASSAYRKLGIESRAECALLLASLAVLAGEGRGVPDDPTCSVLRIAWAVQSLCAARGLTPAESSIVPMLIAGVSDAEIATRRGVSKRTVANQTAALYRKLKVGSRFELARAMTRALLAAHEAS